MKRAVLLIFVAAVLGLFREPVLAYLKLGQRTPQGTTVTAHWVQFPIRYFITNRGVAGVSPQQLEQAVTRSFGAWSSAPLVRLSSEFAGFTGSAPTLRDGVTSIGFDERPDLERILAFANFLFDRNSGEIVESDIVLNSAFPWSAAANGESGRFDVESIALHEIGHLLGLGHSALGETELISGGGRRVLAAEAVMFPIAFSSGTTQGRALKQDDMAGIADSYRDTAFRTERGSISGTVTKGGRGVLGAHVIAFNTRTGKMVAGFSLSEDGRYVIAGLEAGPHVLRVEPLDDGDIESFFDSTLDIDADFQVKFHDRVIVVPAGGGVSNVAISVVAK